MGIGVWLIVGLFGIAFLALGSSLFALAVTRVPVLRTPIEVLEQARSALGLRDGQVIVDAGCADARALITLCRTSQVRGRGYELNGPVWLVGLLRVVLAGLTGRLRVRWRDFFRCDLEDVDLVYCYLMPGLMQRVAEKCATEMPPGGRLVSFLWSVPGWEPSQVLRLGRAGDAVYVYTLPVGVGQAPGVRSSQENHLAEVDRESPQAGSKT